MVRVEEEQHAEGIQDDIQHGEDCLALSEQEECH